MTQATRTISLYGCGGTGANLLQNVIEIPETATGFSKTELTLIDTSTSNFDQKAIADKGINTFLIPGLDGSGKNRKFASENAVPLVNEILTKHKAQDLSVVIFSLSGGSGSVIGPLLIKALIERDKDVVAICIGSTTSGKEASNTLNTIATLKTISAKVVEKPIVAKFYMNAKETNRDVNDAQVNNTIRVLSAFASGKNTGLDQHDIHNCLYYSQPAITNVPPQLVDLMIHADEDGTDNRPSGFVAIAVASLLTKASDELLELGQPYGCEGFMPDGLINATDPKMCPVHFILTNGLMNARMETLKATVDKFAEDEKTLMANASLEVEGDADDNGFHF